MTQEPSFPAAARPFQGHPRSQGKGPDSNKETQIRALKHVGCGAKDGGTGQAERHSNRSGNMAAAQTKGIMFPLLLQAG